MLARAVVEPNFTRDAVAEPRRPGRGRWARPAALADGLDEASRHRPWRGRFSFGRLLVQQAPHCARIPESAPAKLDAALRRLG